MYIDMIVPAANFAMYINIANVRKFLHKLCLFLVCIVFMVVFNLASYICYSKPKQKHLGYKSARPSELSKVI